MDRERVASNQRHIQIYHEWMQAIPNDDIQTGTNWMPFFTEPDHYEKTILSDLQGAWQVLRAEVVDHADFPNWERVLFHTDEAMSWETVRRLERMEPLLLLIRNLAVQGDAPTEVLQLIEDIAEILQEVQRDLKQGKPL